MSTFTAIAIMVGLAFVQRFLYGFDDRWIQNRRDAIVSGIIGGRPASTQDRWTLVYTGWTGAVAGAVGVQVALSLGWIILGQSIDQREPQLFAYVAVFMTWIGVFNWLYQGVVSYMRFRSLLRESESA
jgi:hypothetical protein